MQAGQLLDDPGLMSHVLRASWHSLCGLLRVVRDGKVQLSAPPTRFCFSLAIDSDPGPGGGRLEGLWRGGGKAKRLSPVPPRSRDQTRFKGRSKSDLGLLGESGLP